jgi:hypothetical protein
LPSRGVAILIDAYLPRLRAWPSRSTRTDNFEFWMERPSPDRSDNISAPDLNVVEVNQPARVESSRLRIRRGLQGRALAARKPESRCTTQSTCASVAKLSIQLLLLSAAFLTRRVIPRRQQISFPRERSQTRQQIMASLAARPRNRADGTRVSRRYRRESPAWRRPRRRPRRRRVAIRRYRSSRLV